MTVEGEELLAIGRIAKPFGVHGEVVVRVLADDPERFRTVHTVHLGSSPEDTRPVDVRVVNIGRRGVRLRVGSLDADALHQARCRSGVSAFLPHRFGFPRFANSSSTAQPCRVSTTPAAMPSTS